MQGLVKQTQSVRQSKNFKINLISLLCFNEEMKMHAHIILLHMCNTNSPSKEQELHAPSPFLFQDSASGTYVLMPLVSLESEVPKICF